MNISGANQSSPNFGSVRLDAAKLAITHAEGNVPQLKRIEKAVRKQSSNQRFDVISDGSKYGVIDTEKNNETLGLFKNFFRACERADIEKKCIDFRNNILSKFNNKISSDEKASKDLENTAWGALSSYIKY